MSRQVDVKALVSHIVRGDGIDKCRICMGDTSEGQVFLGDTVMLDGDNPVTLAELLEIITGMEVLLDNSLPSGLCTSCSASVMEAGTFRRFCTEAALHWKHTIKLMDHLPSPECLSSNSRSLYFIMNGDEVTILNDEFELEESKPDINLLPCDDYNKSNQTKIKTKKHKSKKKYICPDCGKIFAYPQHMHQHFEQSTELKRCCHICAEVMSRDKYIIHLVKVHGEKIFPCKNCPALFTRLSQYSEHLSKAHAPGSYGCGDCGRSFQSRFALIAHSGVHALKTCPGCDQIFRNQTCYLHHVKKCCNLNLDKTKQSVHRTKNKVMIEVRNAKSEKKIRVGLRGSRDSVCYCDHCGKRFSGKKFVAAHIQIVHLKNTHRQCSYCGKFLAAAHMTEHIKKHEQITLFTCERCGVTLKTKLGYNQHLRLHTGEMPYACQHCEKSFSASSRRSEHIRKVHRSSEIVLKHKCQFCPARFRLPYKLRKHLETAHADEADGEMPCFKCTQCGEQFGSCRGLVHHSRKHHQFSTKVLPHNKKIEKYVTQEE